VAVVGQEPAPQLDVPVFNSRQLEVDISLARVPLGLSQLPIKEGGIGLVLEVMEPGMRGGRGSRGHGRSIRREVRGKKVSGER
jgi:hypothetical protein